MTLKEVGIVIGKNLEIRRRSVNPPIMVSFACTEVQKSNMLFGSYGEGTTVIEAKKNYCKNISGQKLIMDAMLLSRKEIQLPKRITL